MCGEYDPTATTNETRFILSTTNHDVPVYVDNEHPISYPQIQITPFVNVTDNWEDEQFTSGPGVAPFEVEELDYIKSNTSVYGKEARFAVDILASNALDVYEVRNALESRYLQFINTSLGEFYDPDNFVLDEETGIYSTSEYNDTMVRIARVEEIVEDQRQVLTKVSDIEDIEEGAWFLDESAFYVYPETEMENIRFIEIIYGLVFSDGLCTKEKGLKQLKVRTSTKGYDTDPDVDRWTMMLELRFRKAIIKTIGRSFAEVEVDGEGD